MENSYLFLNSNGGFDKDKLTEIITVNDKKLPVSEKETIPFLVDNIKKYKTFSDTIEETYSVGTMAYHSMTLDLVGIYLKGQKLLYTESKTYCEVLLYRLMLPAILISTVCTVLNVPLQVISYGSVIVSALNGFNSFLLSIVTYLKLDAKAEAHKTSAYQFDKLQTMCEFYSGKILMLRDKEIEKNVNEFIDKLEKKVSEIKDANQFIRPESIRYRYNDIYSYNVFVVMKEYKTSRILNVQKLLDVTKEIEWRKQKPDKKNNDNQLKTHSVVTVGSMIFQSLKGLGIRKKHITDDDEIYRKKNIYSEEDTPLSELYKIREICIKDIIKYRNLSSDLNIKFNEQIENHIDYTNKTFKYIFSHDWLKT